MAAVSGGHIWENSNFNSTSFSKKTFWSSKKGLVFALGILTVGAGLLIVLIHFHPNYLAAKMRFTSNSLTVGETSLPLWFYLLFIGAVVLMGVGSGLVLSNSHKELLITGSIILAIFSGLSIYFLQQSAQLVPQATFEKWVAEEQKLTPLESIKLPSNEESRPSVLARGENNVLYNVTFERHGDTVTIASKKKVG